MKNSVPTPPTHIHQYGWHDSQYVCHTADFWVVPALLSAVDMPAAYREMAFHSIPSHLPPAWTGEAPF